MAEPDGLRRSGWNLSSKETPVRGAEARSRYDVGRFASVAARSRARRQLPTAVLAESRTAFDRSSIRRALTKGVAQ